MRRATIAVLCLAACFQENDLPSDDATSSSTTTTTSSSTSTTVDLETSTDVGSSTGVDPDASSSSSDPTIDPDTSSSTTTEPVTDWALYFDGEATMQSTEDIDLMLGDDFTVETWIRIDSTDAQGPLVQHRGVGTTGWSLTIESLQSRILFGFYDNNGAWHEVIGDDLADLAPGWHHVAGTKHGESLYLHVDGDVSATGSCAQANSAPVVQLELGSSPDDALIYIAIDDVRISSIARYQSAFVPSEDLEADPSTSVLVVSDEGEGSATFDASSQITFDLQGVTWTPGNTAS